MENDSGVVRILIADDHPVFRHGLRKLLEAERGFSVVGEARDGEEAIKLARALNPDILLLDLAMPRKGGMEALRELAGPASAIHTIVLTAAIDKNQLVEALQLGARGVVLKDSATELLVESIRSVMAGQCWVARETVGGLVQALRTMMPASTAAPRKTFGLTRRELEILETIVAGYTNKDIAYRFSISEQTVKHHLTNIFDKLGVHNRLELALFAINHRLISQT